MTRYSNRVGSNMCRLQMQVGGGDGGVALLGKDCKEKSLKSIAWGYLINLFELFIIR